MQHGEGEGGPVATVGVHGRVLWGARRNLAAHWSVFNIVHSQQTFTQRAHLLKRVYRNIKVGAGVDQHLDQGLVSGCAGVHQRSHALRDGQQGGPKENMKKEQNKYIKPKK